MGGGGTVVRSCSNKLFEARICSDQHQQQHQDEDGELKSNNSSSNSSSSSSGSSRKDWRWPVGALQAVELQLGLLSASNRDDDDDVENRHGSPSPKMSRNKSKAHHIDLHPDQPALPHGWEQFLDLNTGEVYYIDWSSCKRTCRDPREVVRIANDKIRAMRERVLLHHQSQHHPQQPSQSFPSTCSAASSSSDFTSHEEDQEEEEASSLDSHDDVMVAAGCHRCLTYFMLPRLDPTCPTCGSHLEVKS